MEVDRKLLDAYYKGQCSEAEKKLVEGWLEMNDYRHYRVLTSPSQQRSIWQKVERRTARQHWALRYRVAAAAACLLCCFAFYVLRPDAADADGQTITVRTGKGQRTKVLLPDSSTVYLKPLSKLVYAKMFGKDRSVSLVGEAYFEVRKDAAHPFVITGDRTETKVLGTSFNLLSRAQAQSISVRTGKVSYRVLSTGKMETLTANQRAELGPRNELSTQHVPADRYMAWTRGELSFDDMPLREIIPQLEEWYGTRFMLDDARLAKATFTGRFKDPTIHELLRSMGFALKFDYSIKDSTINLKPQH